MGVAGLLKVLLQKTRRVRVARVEAHSDGDGLVRGGRHQVVVLVQGMPLTALLVSLRRSQGDYLVVL